MAYTTRLTNVNGTYCCRVYSSDKPLVEARVTHREDIGPAFRDLLRTLDKGFFPDEFTHAARNRCWKPGNRYMGVKHIWLDRRMNT